MSEKNRKTAFEANVEWEKERYREGDKGALIRLVHHYAVSGEKLPDWALEAFTSSIEKWNTGKTDTLDEAFELKPRSKKEKLWKKKYLLVIDEIIWSRANGMSINDALMDDIVKKHGINRTYIWAMYKEMKTELKKDSGDPSFTLDDFFMNKKM